MKLCIECRHMHFAVLYLPKQDADFKLTTSCLTGKSLSVLQQARVSTNQHHLKACMLLGKHSIWVHPQGKVETCIVLECRHSEHAQSLDDG